MQTVEKTLDFFHFLGFSDINFIAQVKSWKLWKPFNPHLNSSTTCFKYNSSVNKTKANYETHSTTNKFTLTSKIHYQSVQGAVSSKVEPWKPLGSTVGIPLGMVNAYKKSRGGMKYWMVCVDNHSDKTWTYFPPVLSSNKEPYGWVLVQN